MTPLTFTQGSDETLQKALAELKERLTAAYPVVRLVLFGSAATGRMDEESDVDVLVLTKRVLSRSELDAIIHIVFEINLKLGINLSTLVIDEGSWEEGPISALPIHDEVEEQGIVL
jgi:predicted nucleotidyltransferase